MNMQIYRKNKIKCAKHRKRGEKIKYNNERWKQQKKKKRKKEKVLI